MNSRIFTNSPYIWFWKLFTKISIGWIRKIGEFTFIHFSDFSLKITLQAWKRKFWSFSEFSLNITRTFGNIGFLTSEQLNLNRSWNDSLTTWKMDFPASRYLSWVSDPKSWFFNYSSFDFETAVHSWISLIDHFIPRG